jgi:hypothetical protein
MTGSRALEDIDSKKTGRVAREQADSAFPIQGTNATPANGVGRDIQAGAKTDRFRPIEYF